MICEAQMAIVPDRKVETALKPRSALLVAAFRTVAAVFALDVFEL